MNIRQTKAVTLELNEHEVKLLARLLGALRMIDGKLATDIAYNNIGHTEGKTIREEIVSPIYQALSKVLNETI